MSLVAALVLVGCGSAPISGVLTDGISKAPIGESKLVAKAAGDASLTCMSFEATTDAEGRFTFEGLCGGTDYKVEPADETLWLADGDTIADGHTGPFDLVGWRASSGSGLYSVKVGALESLRSSADIKSEPVWNSDTERAYYPSTVPSKIVLIKADEHLVLSGASAVADTKFYPLIATGERKFGSKKTKVITMQPWSYIGIEFTSDTEFTRKEATPEAGKVLTKESGDRKVAYISGDALPPGRYAVHKPDAKRTTILDFGKAPEKKAAPAPE